MYDCNMRQAVQLAIRFDEELLREVDKETKRLQKTSNGIRVTRSDTVRYLVKKGLETERR